ncbi:DUF4278 domain-containing protein [Phormidium sp. CCY1219]|uniref:DUF4278 domain-containing protein n=1 Tax=Phormidium sp. CCY1219 TaxID=2886104 RepID=UPI003018F3EF
MELTYRGVTYEYTPPTIEMTEGELGGKYRGLDWRFCNQKKNPVQQPTLELKYRGVAYTTGSQPASAPASDRAAVPATPIPAVVAAFTSEDKARSLMMGHCRSIKKRQQSMLSRLAAEVGLNENISDYWNRIQGKVHPSFRTSYDRSRVSFS